MHFRAGGKFIPTHLLYALVFYDSFPRRDTSWKPRPAKLCQASRRRRYHAPLSASTRDTGTGSGTCVCRTWTLRWSGPRRPTAPPQSGGQTRGSASWDMWATRALSTASSFIHHKLVGHTVRVLPLLPCIHNINTLSFLCFSCRW